MAKIDLTAERVRELFNYCHETGALTARNTENKRYAGDEVGTFAVSKQGRTTRVLAIDGHNYSAHRVIWLYVHGAWPKQEIDHINGNPSDNRIENLRDVSRQINQRNLRKIQTNTSGITGVSWRASKGKWRAYITVQKRCIHLGYFDNMLDAAKARKDALAAYGFSSSHGF
jgi:hypothetical protein